MNFAVAKVHTAKNVRISIAVILVYKLNLKKAVNKQKARFLILTYPTLLKILSTFLRQKKMHLKA